MWNCANRMLWSGATLVLGLLTGGAAFGAKTTCFYDPNSSTPNPFGMRAYLSIVGDERSAAATYDVFPSNESSDPNVKATLEERRELKFYNLGLAAARRYLAKHPEVYHDLIDDEHPLMTYPQFDRHLSCKRGS